MDALGSSAIGVAWGVGVGIGVGVGVGAGVIVGVPNMESKRDCMLEAAASSAAVSLS